MFQIFILKISCFFSTLLMRRNRFFCVMRESDYSRNSDITEMCPRNQEKRNVSPSACLHPFPPLLFLLCYSQNCNDHCFHQSILYFFSPTTIKSFMFYHLCVQLQLLDSLELVANFTAVHLLKKTLISSVTLCFNFDVSLFIVVFSHSLLVVLSQTPTVPKHKSSSSFTPFIDPRLLQVSPSTGSALNNAGKCECCCSLCRQQRS